MSEGRIELELQARAEDYSQEALASIDINVGPAGAAYRGIVNEVRSVIRGSKNFSAIYLEGLYGSGKTLVLRKSAYDIISGPSKKDYERVMPIYFFLGATGFKLLQGFKNYAEEVKTYATTQEKLPTKPYIVGEKIDWKGRLPLLEECLKVVNKVEEGYKKGEEREVLGFFDVLREVNKRGYYPLLIFDEFERVISGEALTTEEERRAFATFARKYLELTRGHLYSGVFVIATTRPIWELLNNAIDEQRPHIRLIFDLLGLRLDRPEDFPMVKPHIVYDHSTELAWLGHHLETLAKKYGLLLHEEVLSLISGILPMPRTVIQIDRKIRVELEKVPEVVQPKDLYKVMQAKIEELRRALEEARTDDGKFLIPPRAVWPERFIKLLENGYFVVKSDKYEEVAKVLGIGGDEGKAKQRVSQVLSKLSELGLYERLGAGKYRLNHHIFAYALGIERLPDGSQATRDELITKIKRAITMARRRRGKAEEASNQTECYRPSPHVSPR
jgi:hypothetical protein